MRGGMEWHGSHAFNYMVAHPHTAVMVDSKKFPLLECLSFIICDKTSSLQSVNEAYKELNRTIMEKPAAAHESDLPIARLAMNLSDVDAKVVLGGDHCADLCSCRCDARSS